MATKKGFCPYCKKLPLNERVFEVNPSATVTYCPRCMKEIEPKKSIQFFQDTVNKKVNEAYKLLLCDTKVDASYQLFADILSIDPNNLRARFGRTLALIYLSTLRDSKIDDALILVKGEMPIYCRGVANVGILASFIKNVNDALDEYYKNMKKMLTYRDYYYDSDCIGLFLERVREICAFKEFLYEKLEELNNKEHIAIESLSKAIEDDIISMEQEMDAEFIDVSGRCYHLVKFKDNSNVAVLGRKEELVETRVEKRRKSSLNPNSRRVSYISDRVFKDYTKKYKLIRASIPLIVILGILTLGDAVSYILLYKETFAIGFLAGGVMFLIAFILSLVMTILGFRFFKIRREKLKF